MSVEGPTGDPQVPKSRWGKLGGVASIAGGYIDSFLKNAFNTVGLKVLGQATEIPFLRYAGALCVIAMLGSAALAMYRQSLPLLIVTIVSFISLMTLLAAIGAWSSAANSKAALIFVWSVFLTFALAIPISVITIVLSFLFEWPRPIDQILDPQSASASLGDISVELRKDASGNLSVNAIKKSKNAYSFDITLVQPESGETLHKFEFPISCPVSSGSVAGNFRADAFGDKLQCVLQIRQGERVIKSRLLNLTVTPAKK